MAASEPGTAPGPPAWLCTGVQEEVEGARDMNLKLYEFLACPAHLWLMIVARLCGGSFEHGPADEQGNFIRNAGAEDEKTCK